MNSAPPLADFDSKWLLLADSETVVHLWKVENRVGYIDRSRRESNHWVWLDEQTLSRVRPCGKVVKASVVRPDLQLG